MKFYYTVASQQDVPQAKPHLSLGGYKSSSPVPNSILGNLFGDISMYTVKNNTANSYIALILVNDGSTNAFSVNMWFNYQKTCEVSTNASIFRIAAVDMVTDADGNLAMEHVPNYHSKPLYAEFTEADGEVNRVNIGDLAAGAVVGIWIEREINVTLLKTQQNAIYEADPSNPYHYLPIELSTEDKIEIGISWE